MLRIIERAFWRSSLAALLFGPWLTLCDTDPLADINNDEEDEAA